MEAATDTFKASCQALLAPVKGHIKYLMSHVKDHDEKLKQLPHDQKNLEEEIYAKSDQLSKKYDSIASKLYWLDIPDRETIYR